MHIISRILLLLALCFPQPLLALNPSERSTFPKNHEHKSEFKQCEGNYEECHHTAENYLGKMYESGGKPENLATAAYWYRAAAERGDRNGIQNLGRLYLWGHGVPQDTDKAIQLFIEAIAHGDPESPFYLGVMYWKGDLVPKNRDTARKWLTLGSKKGSIPTEREVRMIADVRDQRLPFPS